LTGFDWIPGIGDPTLGGWITVLLYVLASASSWGTARQINAEEERRVWNSIAGLFVLLGINKQLDLQSAATEAGRVILGALGWYQQRQSLQLGFIILMALGCLVAAVALLRWARSAPVSTWLALIGVISVIGFVLIRAASFHHIDRLIGATFLGLRWNWILEMGGISMVLLSSLWRRRTAHE